MLQTLVKRKKLCTEQYVKIFIQLRTLKLTLTLQKMHQWTTLSSTVLLIRDSSDSNPNFYIVMCTRHNFQRWLEQRHCLLLESEESQITASNIYMYSLIITLLMLYGHPKKSVLFSFYGRISLNIENKISRKCLCNDHK